MKTENGIEESGKVTIKVTENRELLARIWTKEWADAHAGKVYDAELDPKNWAVVLSQGTKFPPSAYALL